MGHSSDDATGHLISFGNHVFHLHLHVGKRGAKLAKSLLDPIPTGCLAGGGIVVDCVPRDHLIQQRNISRSHGLIDLVVEAGSGALDLLGLRLGLRH
jgi:hypothetical protein